MKKRLFSAVFASIFVAAPLSAADNTNIILVNVDDLGWTDLACFGSKFYETPNLDRLAAEGMKFTNAYAACAVCSPTRAAIMTGRYPARTKITDWIRARFQGGRIPSNGKNPGGMRKVKDLNVAVNPLWMELEEVTIAEVLKKAGYATCHIGKWHLGPNDWYPEKQGFDFNYGGCDYGQPPSYFDPYENRRVKRIHGLPPRKESEYLTDREADEAVGFIRKHKDKPFFLHLCHYAVHTPIQAKKELTAKYEKRKKTNQKSAKYAAMVESVDDAMGRLLDTLGQLEISDRTMIIFTSDNGGLLGPTHNAPLRSGKGFPYEGGIRIPQIIKYPGVTKPGSVCEVPVISVDFLPTICEAIRVPRPEGREIDGVSLMPLLKGEASIDREVLLWHFPHFRGKVVPYSIVRKGDWKLIHRYTGDKPDELFNLKTDIGEKTDLAASETEKVAELKRDLDALLKSTEALVPSKAL